jgi:predicted  nucleic acid-binding Zn-ribbon protein
MFKRTPEISKMLEGGMNYLKKDKKVEELATRRASICAECPHMEPSKIVEQIRDDKLVKVKGHICGSCGCILSFKLRSESSKCPEDKW